jgi:hypothetical protein
MPHFIVEVLDVPSAWKVVCFCWRRDLAHREIAIGKIKGARESIVRMGRSKSFALGQDLSSACA